MLIAQNQVAGAFVFASKDRGSKRLLATRSSNAIIAIRGSCCDRLIISVFRVDFRVVLAPTCRRSAARSLVRIGEGDVYLFFDCETSGLPRSYDAPPSTGSNWPRLLTLGWVFTDARGVELRRDHAMIRPDGWSIEPEAERVHGISLERAMRDGARLDNVLRRLDAVLYQSSAVIAHNFNFDRCVVASEYLRQGRPDPFVGRLSLCTMLSSVDVCQIPGKARNGVGSYKWPRLVELHLFLFGVEPADQHSALGDCRACMRCFFELRRRDLLPWFGSSAKPVGRVAEGVVA